MDFSVQGLAGEILSLHLGPGASYRALKESIALALDIDELAFDLILPGPVRGCPGLWPSAQSLKSIFGVTSGVSAVTVVRRAPELAEALRTLRNIFLAVPVCLHRSVSLGVLFERFPALSKLRDCEELFLHLAHHAKGPWNLELRGLLQTSSELRNSARVCASLAELAPGLLAEMNPELFCQNPSLCPETCIQNLPQACYGHKSLMMSLFERLQAHRAGQSRVLTLLGLVRADILADFAFASAVLARHAVAIEHFLMCRYNEEEQEKLIETMFQTGDAGALAVRFRHPMPLLGRAALLTWCRKSSQLPVATLRSFTREQIPLFHAQLSLVADAPFWLEVLELMQAKSPIHDGLCRNAWLLHPALRDLLQTKLSDKSAFRKLEVALLQAQTDLKQVLVRLLLRSDAGENVEALQRSTMELLIWAGS